MRTDDRGRDKKGYCVLDEKDCRNIWTSTAQPYILSSVKSSKRWTTLIKGRHKNKMAAGGQYIPTKQNRTTKTAMNGEDDEVE